jgi:hypothetical protein
MTIAICGVRFLYEHTLNRNWAIFGVIRQAKRNCRSPSARKVKQGHKSLAALTN